MAIVIKENPKNFVVSGVGGVEGEGGKTAFQDLCSTGNTNGLVVFLNLS